MLARSVGQTALSFPGHGVLDEHLIQPVLTLRISYREKFPGGIAIRGRVVAVVGLKVDDIDLRMGVIDRRADLNVVAYLAVSFEGSENMAQGIWKYQRVLIDFPAVAGFFRRRAASLHDAEFERDEFVLLFVALDRLSQMRRRAVQPIEMRGLAPDRQIGVRLVFPPDMLCA